MSEDAGGRIVVSGVGVVGPHGIGADLMWRSLLAGESAIGALDSPDLQGLPSSAAGVVREFDPAPWIERRSARRMGRFAQFALVATHLALADAALSSLDPERTGITIHTGAGGIPEGDAEVLARQHDPTRVGPLYVPLVSANMAAANAAIALGVTGPVTAGVGACAAGVIGIAEGYGMLLRGDADVVLAGAADAALTPFLISSLANAGAMSTASGDPASISRPFDLDRTGFVAAEGAGMVVLERLATARARGIVPYCEIAGAAIGCDAFHVTAPEPTGAGAERAMRRALANAAVDPGSVGAIIAHGTGTKLNDASESAAIGRVFGDRRIPVTAPKSTVGHTLGAAGAFGAITGALVVRHSLLPPVLNYETPDPECDLAIVAGGPLAADVDAAIVNAFGFGGQNGVLVLRRCT